MPVTHCMQQVGMCIGQMPKTTTTNTTACCSTESTARICHMCIVRYLLLLAHCVEHGWSSDSVGSHTAIRRRSRERGVLLRDDRSRVRKKQIATAIQQHVDLPHVPVTDHCAAAAGR